MARLNKHRAIQCTTHAIDALGAAAPGALPDMATDGVAEHLTQARDRQQQTAAALEYAAFLSNRERELSQDAEAQKSAQQAEAALFDAYYGFKEMVRGQLRLRALTTPTLATFCLDEDPRWAARLAGNKAATPAGQSTPAAGEASASQDQTSVATLKKSIEKEHAPRPKEIEVLCRAIKVESETSAFYQKMADELGEQGQFFARFLEIEQGHLAMVNAELDSVSGIGYWFDTPEWQFQDG